MSALRNRSSKSVWLCLLLSGCSGADSLAWLQWPAMVITVTASWFVTSRYKKHRWAGFALFLASNVLWAVWGLHTGATALVVLQAALALLNILGLKRTDSDKESE